MNFDFNTFHHSSAGCFETLSSPQTNRIISFRHRCQAPSRPKLRSMSLRWENHLENFSEMQLNEHSVNAKVPICNNISESNPISLQRLTAHCRNGSKRNGFRTMLPSSGQSLYRFSDRSSLECKSIKWNPYPNDGSSN